MDLIKVRFRWAYHFTNMKSIKHKLIKFFKPTNKTYETHKTRRYNYSPLRLWKYPGLKFKATRPTLCCLYHAPMTGENSKMSFRRCLDLNYSTSWVEIFAKDSKSKGGKKFRLDGSLHHKVLTKNSFVTSRYLIKRECIVQFLTCCILQKSVNEKHLNSIFVHYSM